MNKITINGLEIEYARNPKDNSTTVSLPNASFMWPLQHVLKTLNTLYTEERMTRDLDDTFQTWLTTYHWVKSNQDSIWALGDTRNDIKNLREIFYKFTAKLAEHPFDKNYIATIRASAVRDVQYDTKLDSDPMSDAWRDMEQAEIYLGIFGGLSAEQVTKIAANYADTDPENIRLIPIE